MKTCKYLVLSLLPLILVPLLSTGCATAARSTEGFALVDTATVDAKFTDAWQATKAVLREQKLDIYTRDKRGVFVAYTSMKRQHRLFTPKRTQFTVTLEPATDQTTKVTVETIQQVYGVGLLNYPNWHDRKATDNKKALTILEGVQAKLSNGQQQPSAPAS